MSVQSPEAKTHGGPELAKSGDMAGKERTHGGRMVDTYAKSKHMAGGAAKRTHDGHVADTRRSHGEHIYMAHKVCTWG